MASNHSLIILDDYQNIAFGRFKSLNVDLPITSEPNTLPPSTTPEGRDALVKRLQPYTIISSMRERTAFPAEVLEQLPNLKLLMTTGARNAAIDTQACKDNGIMLTGTSYPGAVTAKQMEEQNKRPDNTTQHTVAMLLGLAGNLAANHTSVVSGGWQMPHTLSLNLTGKTLGLVGLGRLGSGVARIAVVALGMKILAWSTNLTQEGADEKAASVDLPKSTFKVASSKEQLFRDADVVSLHYVLSERSRGIVGAKELDLMKKSAMLVNTSRGPLVDERSLLETLKAGKIRGAALDVFDIEPLPADSEWRTTKWGVDGRSQVLLTPHVGYVEEYVIRDWYNQQAENLARFLKGEEVQYRWA